MMARSVNEGGKVRRIPEIRSFKDVVEVPSTQASLRRRHG